MTPELVAADQDFDPPGHGRIPVKRRVDNYDLFILFWVVIDIIRSVFVAAGCGNFEMPIGAGRPCAEDVWQILRKGRRRGVPCSQGRGELRVCWRSRIPRNEEMRRIGY